MRKKSCMIISVLLIGVIVTALFSACSENDTDIKSTSSQINTEIANTENTIEETEKCTEPETIETKSADIIDANKEYWSDVLQQSGDSIYYCSSDNVDGILNLPILDFSNAKPDYIKVTGKDNASISSFIIYGDKMFYISDYGFRNYYSGPYSFGNLYVSDISGNNCELIESDVSNLQFMITNGKLYYQLYEDVSMSYTSKCYSYDLTTKEINSSSKELGNFTSKYIFKSVYSNDDYTEFDGGNYYVERLGGEIREINGQLANWIYIRKDIETGQEEEIGYSYSQVG